MATLGHLIKGAIHITDRLLPETNPIEDQENILVELLHTSKETKFGLNYGFKDILNAPNIAQAYAEKVPYHDYNAIHEPWWSKIEDGENDITWPETPQYFALSSGTTGNTSKRIPVTNAMLKAIKNAGIKQVLALRNFDLSADFYEKDILMLGSSTDLRERVDNKLEGEISGISASNIPFWFEPYYKPGKEISQINDWDKRVERIAKEAKNWDVAALSGIPSWIELMLQKVISYNNCKTIHDIWPNLQVYTSGGVAFGPYEKNFKALFGKNVFIIDTYLASEGYIATQIRPDTNAMQLNTNHGIYFEFVPFDPEYITPQGGLVQNAPAITLSEVLKDVDYVLIISTVSGAWRYIIGDTITFTNTEHFEIKITGRTKFFLNTVGSQLSVNKMDDGIKHLEDCFDTTIKEYTLAALRDKNGDYYHHWYLGTPYNGDPTTLATRLDTFLGEVNKNYKVARSKALKYIKVSTVAPQIFNAWNAKQKKKGGQVKMARVMAEDKFKEWQQFVKDSTSKHK